MPSTPNWCIKNCATFNINDKLILSDGILWDVNSGREIYNFGKRDVELNGIFHPNGTEIILRGEIWDLRTFNLLKTVPDLDQMKIMFSPVNHIIYAYWWNLYLTGNSQYTTSFKTLDALDYSTIGKRLILAENIKITNPFKYTLVTTHEYLKNKSYFGIVSHLKLSTPGFLRHLITNLK